MEKMIKMKKIIKILVASFLAAIGFSGAAHEEKSSAELNQVAFLSYLELKEVSCLASTCRKNANAKEILAEAIKLNSIEAEQKSLETLQKVRELKQTILLEFKAIRPDIIDEEIQGYIHNIFTLGEECSEEIMQIFQNIIQKSQIKQAFTKIIIKYSKDVVAPIMQFKEYLKEERDTQKEELKVIGEKIDQISGRKELKFIGNYAKLLAENDYSDYREIKLQLHPQVQCNFLTFLSGHDAWAFPNTCTYHPDIPAQYRS